MKKLIAVRHGESICNACGIIQGKNNDYGLTSKGRQDVISNVNENLELLEHASKIISSPYARAIETAEEISKISGLNIETDSRLSEMDAGILAGLPKKEAEIRYPEYYSIWKKRLDLDEIPNAEKGEILQARILAFLLQYYDKDEFCDILVTHAGFIRCLINTIEGRERTNQFNIENGNFFELDDIFQKLHIEQRKRAMNSRVYIVETQNGNYVAKIKKGQITEQDEAEKQLLEQLTGENVPKILAMQPFDDKNYCKIIKYVKGEHKYGKLNDEEYMALINSEKLYEDILSRVNYGKFRTNDLVSKLENIQCTAKQQYIKMLAEELLRSPKSISISDKSKYVLSHNDFNRDNILFERLDNGTIRANVIDFESLEYAPKDFQFASMLASGILLEGESMEKIIETIKSRGKDLNTILYLMQIRLIEGLHFFADRSNTFVQANKKVANDLLKRYFYANEMVKKEINKSIGDVQGYD